MKSVLKTILYLYLGILLAVLVAPPVLAGDTWSYNIETGETGIDENKTTAYIYTRLPADPDYDKREIRLPKIMPSSVSFWDAESYDYIILTPQGVQKFNSQTGNLETIIPKTEVANPVAVFTSAPFPDVLVAEQVTSENFAVRHYSFTGDSYEYNPIFNVQGLREVISLSSRDVDIAVLEEGKAVYYAFDGNEMIKIPALSVETGLQNPIAACLFTDQYGFIVAEQNTLKYYKEGSLISTLSGLNEIKGLYAADGGNLVVIEGKEVKHYNILEDGSICYNSVLSITNGINNPRAVALKPGSFDKIVIDGNNVRYFSWVGDQYVENSHMSTVIEGLQDIGFYVKEAVAESIVYTASRNINALKITIEPDGLKPQEENTSIEWYVTANGNAGEPDWVKVELNKWAVLNTAGKDIKWKAVLKTANREKTPRINPKIVIYTNTRPDPPDLSINPNPNLGQYYYTSTPPIRWKFTDNDGDAQGSYRIRVFLESQDINTDTPIWDSGVVASSDTECIIDENGEGILWNTGFNRFKVVATVADELDLESLPSVINIGIRAFDRPLIKQVITPPLNDRLLAKGVLKQNLDAMKAGSLVVMHIPSLGIPDNAKFDFIYKDSNGNNKTAFLEKPPAVIQNRGANNQIWEVRFYTESSPDIIPNGTLIQGKFTINGLGRSVMELVELNGGTIEDLYGAKPASSVPNWYHWLGYSWWGEGILITNDTALKNWSVVLKGRD